MNRYSWKREDVKAEAEAEAAAGTFTEVVGKDRELLNNSKDRSQRSTKGGKNKSKHSKNNDNKNPVRDSENKGDRESKNVVDRNSQHIDRTGKSSLASTLSDIVGEEPKSFQKYRGSTSTQPINLNQDVNVTPSLTDIIGKEPEDFSDHRGAAGTKRERPRISDISFISAGNSLDSKKSLKIKDRLEKFLRENEAGNFDRELSNMLSYYETHGEESLFVLLNARYGSVPKSVNEVEPLQTESLLKIDDKSNNRNTFVDQRKSRKENIPIKVESYETNARHTSASLMLKSQETFTEPVDRSSRKEKKNTLEKHRKKRDTKESNRSTKHSKRITKRSNPSTNPSKHSVNQTSSDKVIAFPPPSVDWNAKQSSSNKSSDATNLEMGSLLNIGDKSNNRNTFVDQRKTKNDNNRITVASYENNTRHTSASQMLSNQEPFTEVPIEKSSTKKKTKTLDKKHRTKRVTKQSKHKSKRNNKPSGQTTNHHSANSFRESQRSIKSVRGKLKAIGVNLKSRSMAIAFSKIRELELEREKLLQHENRSHTKSLPAGVNHYIEKNPNSCEMFQQDMRSPRLECVNCGVRRLDHI
eukprot:CAMPEP_0204875016 /NCGR_PEP_ID=MMETSP1348-20121228/44779_1 /ASSEMBLY_ACC=CAM_ASM_000700 /TAXON_ID=215587 /ORGANISM="Aplanochytrium stocchinoi, Strain GSBS06" /LENGTH=582 /DNA_ID=CAMNT_0052031199 /DNA_START=62 /DNA_END=1810 /DNA_ORIENTATION=-